MEFNFISFLEGFVLGFLCAGVFWLAVYLQLKDIAKAIRNPKDIVAKDLLGRTKKAQIIRKKSDIDILLEE